MDSPKPSLSEIQELQKTLFAKYVSYGKWALRKLVKKFENSFTTTETSISLDAVSLSSPMSSSPKQNSPLLSGVQAAQAAIQATDSPSLPSYQNLPNKVIRVLTPNRFVDHFGQTMRRIQKENLEGWKVVQIDPCSKVRWIFVISVNIIGGCLALVSIATIVGPFLILGLSNLLLYLFATGQGYVVVFEKEKD